MANAVSRRVNGAQEVRWLFGMPAVGGDNIIDLMPPPEHPGTELGTGIGQMDHAVSPEEATEMLRGLDRVEVSHLEKGRILGHLRAPSSA